METDVIMHGARNVGVALSLVAAAIIIAPSADAYETYDGCRGCHGDFRDDEYISLSDAQNWGSLHNLHRFTMLGGDCDTCHPSTGFDTPFIGVSAGGEGFAAISCAGCHGRDEDMGHDAISPGRGAGLRQHHWNVGFQTCGNAGCHTDADPAVYTPVGEHILPSYYFQPDPAHPDKPTAPCNLNGEEDYAGIAEGLDNDGDGVYDEFDSDCDSCPFDLDGSGQVGFGDLVIVLSTWDDAGGPADLDESGFVDFGDLVLVLSSWDSC